ncbi:hypothetical protein [Vibrio coralliilyticus]|uniref:Transcriptional regulator VspR n=1 Tax=Vibrio coralliilyticus TaxID=190893 RepID=A0AAP6ZSJ6_9VIBR|nr:hypothetical protein [Vibrio coralliilyticus]NOJ25050.1 hypothetical protein [Vibrio coralliilyticus]
MGRSRKISAMMYKLLIEKRMDGFSVVELRDASLSLEEKGIDMDEARKKIYRQLARFEKNSWLQCVGSGRNKRYYKTDSFNSLQFVPKLDRNPNSFSLSSDYSVLNSEYKQYKGELEIVLGEIDEYQSLKERFPELVPKLNVFLEQAKTRSAKLLGKVNVLANVLKTLSEDCQQC